MTVISEKDQETYAGQGFLVLRRAFAKTRIEALLAAVERLIDKGLAGECELGWIDRDRRLPSRTSHLLNPDKYHPAFADWIDEDLAPHLEALIRGPGVRHSLFGMLASGAGNPYTQKWHRDLGRPGDPDETAYLLRHEGIWGKCPPLRGSTSGATSTTIPRRTRPPCWTCSKATAGKSPRGWLGIVVDQAALEMYG